MSAAKPVETGKFLVCGLGSLGQYCVSILKEFGASVNAIELHPMTIWQIPEVPDLIDQLFIGDCCQPSLLEEVRISQYRAILLVTSDERVNIEAAFAIRSLDPTVRLIVRSAQDNLNEILSHELGNFVAFEATQLPASSFALAALATETRGFFALDEYLLRVVRITIDRQHSWCNRRSLYALNSSTRRLLTHTRINQSPPQAFYQWEPDATVEEGDSIVYLEIVDHINESPSDRERSKRDLPQWSIEQLKQTAIRIWREGTQTQRVAIVSAVTMFFLFILASVIYKFYDPTMTLQESINVALVLIIGGFDNLFGQFHLQFSIPWWLHLFSFFLTIAGTVFTGILYAILTERILVSRFQFTRRRPMPEADHVVIVGLGRVGQRVATILEEMKQPTIGVNATTPEPALSLQIPVVVDNLKSALSKVNLADAKSVLAVTDDEVLNLEIALRARGINPDVNLIIRAFKPSFQQNVSRLLPKARVLGAYALAAEAFAAAAFGENILNLFRLNDQTLLVTEYTIEVNDHLAGLLLSEVAYGYEVIPVLHQRPNGQIKLMPNQDVRLEIDDRLVVIASILGLKRIERGEAFMRSSHVFVEKAMSQDAAFDGASAIARITGCDISTARSLMGQLPATLGFPLYSQQAHRLVRELRKVQVIARLVEN
jgi:Trk K+ transport system NAD-binding subunit